MNDDTRVVDPELGLAASIAMSPGVYAALLGSGMSTAAGIKTGWEFTKELGELIAQHQVRIPSHSVHPFRSNPYTDSDVFVHPLRRNS
jgi:hypothetical protein